MQRRGRQGGAEAWETGRVMRMWEGRREREARESKRRFLEIEVGMCLPGISWLLKPFALGINSVSADRREMRGLSLVRTVDSRKVFGGSRLRKDEARRLIRFCQSRSPCPPCQLSVSGRGGREVASSSPALSRRAKSPPCNKRGSNELLRKRGGRGAVQKIQGTLGQRRLTIDVGARSEMRESGGEGRTAKGGGRKERAQPQEGQRRATGTGGTRGRISTHFLRIARELFLLRRSAAPQRLRRDLLGRRCLGDEQRQADGPRPDPLNPQRHLHPRPRRPPPCGLGIPQNPGKHPLHKLVDGIGCVSPRRPVASAIAFKGQTGKLRG